MSEADFPERVEIALSSEGRPVIVSPRLARVAETYIPEQLAEERERRLVEALARPTGVLEGALSGLMAAGTKSDINRGGLVEALTDVLAALQKARASTGGEDR